MSPRTAERKLSSRERCERAFESIFEKGHFEQMSVIGPKSAAWIGWYACWRYLEERVQKEYIEA